MGRNESGLNEKNDCTIRAYAAMKGITYLDAYTWFYLKGRKPRRGTNVHYEIYNKEFHLMNRPNMTVQRFILTYAKVGKWIIQIRGHVFAVIDGQIYDTCPEYNLNRHVICAWLNHPKEK